MARTILVAGTASHVGKSTVAAGLCRLLADRGVDVAPFKAQNMSNNARAVPRASAVADHTAGSDAAAVDIADSDIHIFGEIGVSQYVQARAARVQPTTDMNPVLLKPRGDGESQLVVDGVGVGHFAAGSYYDEHWSTARNAAESAHRRLAARHDVIIAEGAGSIAEINLHHRDLANVETARFADAEILLVADIERGGVFGSLIGTLELMPDDLRDRVCGAVITKFRGDVSLLEPGLDEFEQRTGVEVVGVLPYDDPGLPEEDSVGLPAVGERAVFGDDDGVAADRSVTVAVPRLPRVSNFTDLEPLAAEPGVRVAYVPLDSHLDDADAVVIPGTKNTVDDLLAMQSAGFDRQLQAFSGPVVGLCGGYQMLGEHLNEVAHEASGSTQTEHEPTIPAIGLLPVETTFSATKEVVDTTLDLTGCGPLAGANGPVSGYEIHMGQTTSTGEIERPFSRAGESTAALGARCEHVIGCYLHGLFENDAVREAFVENVFRSAGRDSLTENALETQRDDSPYDRAAQLLGEHCSLDWLEQS